MRFTPAACLPLTGGTVSGSVAINGTFSVFNGTETLTLQRLLPGGTIPSGFAINTNNGQSFLLRAGTSNGDTVALYAYNQTAYRQMVQFAVATGLLTLKLAGDGDLTTVGGALAEKHYAPTYSASITPDATAGNSWTITATNGSAFTINAPTTPTTGQRITLTIRNASGGVQGAVTFNAVFKTAGYTVAANGFSASADFEYDGTNWVQKTAWVNTIPN